MKDKSALGLELKGWFCLICGTLTLRSYKTCPASLPDLQMRGGPEVFFLIRLGKGLHMGFAGGTVVKSPRASAGDVRSLGWEDPLKVAWQPAPVFLPGESRGQRSLVGCSC